MILAIDNERDSCLHLASLKISLRVVLTAHKQTFAAMRPIQTYS